LTTRTRSETVTFARPFFLRKVDRELPAGSYAAETEEETLGSVSALSYRRIEVRLFIPRIAGKSEAEMWVISPGELDAALALDREPSSRPEPGVHRTAPHSVAAVRKTEEHAVSNRNAMQSRNKGSNLPLYGAVLGILTLLLATAVFGQQDSAEGAPPAYAAQGSSEN
jgi:hypothetical protein